MYLIVQPLVFGQEKSDDETNPGLFSIDDLADIGVDEGAEVADYGNLSKFKWKIEYVIIELKK